MGPGDGGTQDIETKKRQRGKRTEGGFTLNSNSGGGGELFLFGFYRELGGMWTWDSKKSSHHTGDGPCCQNRHTNQRERATRYSHYSVLFSDSFLFLSADLFLWLLSVGMRRSVGTTHKNGREGRGRLDFNSVVGGGKRRDRLSPASRVWLPLTSMVFRI